MPIGCTDVKLEPNSNAADDRVAIDGDFCTSKAEQSSQPIRILFVIDSSTSMATNDPGDLHVDAIDGVVTQFAGQENVTFGILRWGETIVRELRDPITSDEILFTNDRAVIDPAFTRMRQNAATNPQKYLGGTNYELALAETDQYLQEDTAANSGTSATHRYYIQFMTDGMPQASSSEGATTRSNILLAIEGILESFDARLDVISIVEFVAVPEIFLDLLPTMADLGLGSFHPLTTPESLETALTQILTNDLLLIEFDIATINGPQEPKGIVVTNRNMRIAEVEGVIDVYVDSDGDGLVDAEEIIYGTNPADADSDRDGLDDLFEQNRLGEFDPLAKAFPDLTVDELADDDGDGLNNFVENRLNLDPHNPDSDSDGMPDGLEYRSGSDPLFIDMGSDVDADNISTAFELRQHTHPDLVEGRDLSLDRSYIVDTVGDPYQVYNGRRCYRFGVSNISLAETIAARNLEGVRHPEGYNQIDIWRIEKPVPKEEGARTVDIRRVIRGYTSIIFLPTLELRDPPAYELPIREANFDF